jgi:hypothetical protein
MNRDKELVLWHFKSYMNGASNEVRSKRKAEGVKKRHTSVFTEHFSFCI